MSAIDPAGSVGPIDSNFEEVQIAVSRLRSVKIDMPFKKASRFVSYKNWLTQTCP